MKNRLLVAIVLLVSVTLSAEVLSQLSESLKRYSPEIYNGIRDRAVSDWATDHSMVAYEINRQIDALSEALVLLEEDPNVGVKVLFKWCDDPARLESNPEDGLVIPTDWVMVVYEYKRQRSAKLSY